MIMQRGFTVFWETVGKIWDTISASENGLKHGAFVMYTIAIAPIATRRCAERTGFSQITWLTWRSDIHWRRKGSHGCLGPVATSPLALRWLCDSPRTGCARRTTPTYMWREQAIVEWPRRVNSIVACRHGMKLCALAARAFRSQQPILDFEIWHFSVRFLAKVVVS